MSAVNLNFNTNNHLSSGRFEAKIIFRIIFVIIVKIILIAILSIKENKF